MLQVWDVKAMHHVFIKEQEFYEEPVAYVFTLLKASDLVSDYMCRGLRLLLGPGLLGVLGEVLSIFSR